ncbi:MAG: alpha/beta hydrolase fold domain-containing protein [Steroidobacteraceae bacterium]|jgi:pimeloyl-ACP methyl ester carboxylesterase
MIKTIPLAIIAALICAIGTACSAGAAKPPAQPPSGPGGKDVAHAGVIATRHGSGPQAYWLFEPDNPKPESASLIVFNHGWGAMDPRIYQAWIDHIVERGNIVVYPLYQDSLRTAVTDFTPNAIAAVQDAIRTLQNEAGHVKPRLTEFAIVGHSMGGAISANMAALWKAQGLPLPRAILCVEPGKTWGKPLWATIKLADLSQIPADALLVTVTGDRDHLVRDIDAKRIFNESTQVPLANKNFVTLVSDDHGQPALKASHAAPVAWAPMPEGTRQVDSPAGSPQREMLGEKIEERRSGDDEMPDLNHANRTLDALDFFGTWKLLDGLTDAAFFGKNKNYALGNTPEQRYMGIWSDGVPVRELIVTDHP